MASSNPTLSKLSKLETELEIALNSFKNDTQQIVNLNEVTQDQKIARLQKDYHEFKTLVDKIKNKTIAILQKTQQNIDTSEYAHILHQSKT